MSRSAQIFLVSLLLVLVLSAIAYQFTLDLPEESQLIWRLPIFLVGSGAVGLLALVYLLPAVGDKISDMFYSAPGEVKPDSGSKARALVAQGDYEGALEAYLTLSEELPSDRLPVVEAARLAKDKLGDARRALQIIEDALQGRDWPEDDAAYFLFRLIDLHENDLQEREHAVVLLQQVAESFPETRHAANAIHKLKEWGVNPTTSA